jgi:hypothetical protein
MSHRDVTIHMLEKDIVVDTDNLSSQPNDASYQPSERERKAMDEILKNDASKAPSFRIKKDDDHLKILADHEIPIVGDALIAEAMGTSDLDFYRGLLDQVGRSALRDGKIAESSLNFLISVIKGIQPKDQLEAMLAAQTAAVHVASMDMARRLGLAQSLEERDSAAGALSKLSRTFAMQMDTLKHYRSSGEQKVTVNNVSVGKGGQAVVGDIAALREASDASAQMKPAADAASKRPSLTVVDENSPAPIPFRRSRAK